MKTIIKLTTIGLLTLILSAGNVSGKEQSSVPVKGNGRGIAGILSAQQKEMLKQRSAMRQTYDRLLLVIKD